MTTPVNLSVHRNTLKKRRIAEMRQTAVASMKSMVRSFPVTGYAIVSWDEKNNYRATWNLGEQKNLPGQFMPEFVKVSLMREIMRADAQGEINSRLGPPPDDSA